MIISRNPNNHEYEFRIDLHEAELKQLDEATALAIPVAPPGVDLLMLCTTLTVFIGRELSG